MTKPIEIPLNKLTAWEGNVRKTQNKGDIAELAANIKAIGLIQNLAVIADGKKFAVIAGNRRLAALQQLVKSGDIKDSHPVSCKVYDNAAQAAAEVSLAENVMRVNMHPADECDAFKAQIDSGMPLPDVAARFGKTEKYVQQRLKLAKVSKKVIKAFRAGELTLEQVQAFAISDDHKKQNEVLDDINPEHTDADDIRYALTEHEIRATDRRVKLVTLKAYEAAGGKLKRDLFGDEKDIYIEDEKLLDKLVTEKLEKTAERARKEGWKWVEVRPEFSYTDKARFTTLKEELTPLPPKKQEQLEHLEKQFKDVDSKLDALSEADEGDDENPDIDKLRDVWNDLQSKIDKINKGRSKHWPEDKLAIAGAVIHIAYDGIEIERGLVKPEDKAAVKAVKSREAEQTGGDAGDNAPEKDRGEFSAGLTEDLTSHRSAALSAALIARPDIGLIVIVHALASQIFSDLHKDEHAAQIEVHEQSFDKVEGSKALATIAASRETWEKQLPEDQEHLWDWLAEQKPATLQALLTFCVAVTLDDVQKKFFNPERLKHASQIAAALKLDMKEWFTPTAENYFSRVGKPQLLEAINDVSATPPSNGMKKAELVKYADQSVNGKGWLPKPLR